MTAVDGPGAETTAQYLRGLRVASTAVTAAILATSLPLLLVGLDRYRSVPVEVVGYATSWTVVVAAAVVLFRGLSWGRLDLPVASVVFAVSALARVGLPPEAFAPSDWALGCLGWVGMLVLFDRGARFVAAFVIAHAALNGVLLILLVEDVDGPVLLTYGLLALAVSSFPLTVCAADVALRRVAAAAQDAVRKGEQVRTEQAVARRLHEDRRRRYTELAQAVRPLLTGLADGTIDPSDHGTQRRCAIEAARMRRLFAEADDVDDPLLHELGACVDLAERRGVVVALATRGSRPVLPREVRRGLTDAPLAALATAGGSARVTVVGTAAGVTVSVVTDAAPGDPGPDPPRPVPGIRVSTFREDGTVWVEAQWTPQR